MHMTAARLFCPLHTRTSRTTETAVPRRAMSAWTEPAAMPGIEKSDGAVAQSSSRSYGRRFARVFRRSAASMSVWFITSIKLAC